jgi:hypothetical protein
MPAASPDAVLHLDSEPAGKWDTLRVALMSPVTLDERSDLAWAECEPSFRVNGQIHHLVLLQPRYGGDSLWDIGTRSIPVYVCTTRSEHLTNESLSRPAVRVLEWAVVTEVR